MDFPEIPSVVVPIHIVNSVTLFVNHVTGFLRQDALPAAYTNCQKYVPKEKDWVKAIQIFFSSDINFQMPGHLDQVSESLNHASLAECLTDW